MLEFIKAKIKNILILFLFCLLLTTPLTGWAQTVDQESFRPVTREELKDLNLVSKIEQGQSPSALSSRLAGSKLFVKTNASYYNNQFSLVVEAFESADNQLYGRLELNGEILVEDQGLIFLGQTSKPNTTVAIYVNKYNKIITRSDHQGEWQTSIDYQLINFIGDKTDLDIKVIIIHNNLISQQVKIGQIILSRSKLGRLDYQFVGGLEDQFIKPNQLLSSFVVVAWRDLFRSVKDFDIYIKRFLAFIIILALVLSPKFAKTMPSWHRRLYKAIVFWQKPAEPEALVKPGIISRFFSYMVFVMICSGLVVSLVLLIAVNDLASWFLFIVYLLLVILYKKFICENCLKKYKQM